MVNKNSWFRLATVILLAGLIVTGYGGLCGKKTKRTTATDTGSSTPAIIPDTTKVIASSATEISADNSTFTFATTATDVTNLAVGNVMVGGVSAQSPNGFLRKVSSVNEINNQLVISTTQATLEDAIQDGTIELNQSLSPDDVNKAVATKGVTLKAVGDTFSPSLDNVVIWDFDNNPNTTYDQIIANGSFTFSASIDFKVRIEWFHIEEARAVLSLDESAQLTISSNINFPTIDKTKRIATYYFTPVIIPVGPVPVVVTPVLTVDVGINGQVEVSITTNITQTANLAVGLQYSNDAWSPVMDFTKSFSNTPPTLSAGLSIQGYIQPRINILVYGIVGAYADAKGYLQLDANVASNPWWELWGGLEAGAGVEVSVLGRTIANYELLKIIDYKESLAQAPPETVSAPNQPTGTTSGNAGTSYSYSTSGGLSILGHPIEYQFDWKGDGTDLSAYGSATQSKSWSSAGTYSVKARARCTTHTTVVSAWSSGLSVSITGAASETVSAPTQPTGTTAGTTGASYSYSTGGSSSSLGHTVEYQFDWKGDGTTDLSGWGSATQSKTWSTAGTYSVKARARCTTHTTIVSVWSSGLSVNMSTTTTETVSTPTPPTGTTSGTTGASYTYSTGGSSSSLGHTVEYQFDWKGDGTTDLSGWGSATQSKTWSTAGTYSVKARARCTTHTSVVSGWSSGLSVIISVYDTTPPTVSSVNPANNSTNVSASGNISVTFSEPMSQTTAQSAFSILPAVSGAFSWSGNTMTFDPTSNLAYDTLYTGTVSTAAKDLAGNNITSQYQWSFTTPWVITTLDSAGAVGMYSSIAIDSTNKVHISYYDTTNDDLKYATNASGSWIYTTLDSADNVGEDTSIAIDSNNKVHISYFDYTTGNIKYATNASDSWVYTTLYGSGCYGHTSIAIDSNNKVHISYCMGGALQYATNVSGYGWDYTSIDPTGDVDVRRTRIVLDSMDKAYISYFDFTPFVLKYATNASGSWVNTTLANGYSNSIALDSNNKAHISYYEKDNSDLTYATNASGSWVYSTINSQGYVSVNSGTSITLDSTNKAHISYYAWSSGDLKYATNASGSWVDSTLDSADNVGEDTSIAIDSNNKVHISYYDTTNGNLKYATNK